MSDERLERCCLCDAATGRAGRADDSLYLDTGNAELGPLCPSCWQGISDAMENDLTTKLSTAQAELATVKRCGDDAVQSWQIADRLAERQTRLLEEAQAELATAQAACAAMTRLLGDAEASLYRCHDIMSLEQVAKEGGMGAVLQNIGAILRGEAAPNPGQPLLDRLAKAEGIVAKLPKTEDGVPITPGMYLWHPGFMDRDTDDDGEPVGPPFWNGPHKSGPVSADLFVAGREGSSSCPHSYAGRYSCEVAADAAALAAQEQPHAE